MSRNNHKTNTGSTLIEVLVAIVIVGLVITGVMLSISYSVRNSAEARYREAASQLAQDGMEVVVLRREIDPWSTFSNLSGIYCIPADYSKLDQYKVNASDCDNNLTVYNKNYSRYVTISKITDPITGKAIMTAAISVKWQSESNTTMDVQISQTFKERAI